MRRRISAVALLASTLALSGYALVDSSAKTRTLWSADQESGDLSQWAPGGGVFNSGSGHIAVSSAFARTGRYSLALTIAHADGHHGDQAARIFRWQTTDGNAVPLHAVYDAWYLFPKVVRAPDWWNVMQWKTRLGADRVDPTFILNVGNRPSGAMYLYLWDAIRRLPVGEARMNIAPGRWMHIRVRYHWSVKHDGSVTIFQDGHKIIAVNRVQTQYRSNQYAPRHWSINNYSARLRPSAGTIYVDDARIEAG